MSTWAATCSCTSGRDLKCNVVPDVWVAFGVAKRPERGTWLIWLEGKGPDFVLEITSKSTRRRTRAARRGSTSNLVFANTGSSTRRCDYLDPILKGRELGPDGKYRDLVLKERDGVLRHLKPSGSRPVPSGRAAVLLRPGAESPPSDK